MENINKYENGKIYKIVCHTTGSVYFGSTYERTLNRRLNRHEQLYKNHICNNGKYLSSFDILENNNYEIVLVEEFPCQNKNELLDREKYYIENFECVNIRVPNRTRKEYYEKFKEEILDRRYYQRLFKVLN